MPLLARILSHFTSTSSSSTSTTTARPPKHLPGPWSLGRASIPLNVLGFLFLLFTSITFNFPTVYPVDRDNMNYTSAAVGVIALISLVTWVAGGRRSFTGPRVVGVEGTGTEAVVGGGDGEGMGMEKDGVGKRGY